MDYDETSTKKIFCILAPKVGPQRENTLALAATDASEQADSYTPKHIKACETKPNIDRVSPSTMASMPSSSSGGRADTEAESKCSGSFDSVDKVAQAQCSSDYH